ALHRPDLRKSCFERLLSKESFRQVIETLLPRNFYRPGRLSGTECKPVTSAPPAPDSRSAREPRPGGTSERTGLRARWHHQHHSSYAPDQPERHETQDPVRPDAVNPRFQYVGLASGRRRAGVGLASWWPSRRSRYPSAREVAATAIMAA